MTPWLEGVVDAVGTLALAASAPLVVGALGVRVARQPAARQAWAEWSAAVAVLAVALAMLPLPRLTGSLQLRAAASIPTADVPAAAAAIDAAPTAGAAPGADLGRAAALLSPPLGRRDVRRSEPARIAAEIEPRTSDRAATAEHRPTGESAAQTSPTASAPRARPRSIRPLLASIWCSGTALLLTWLALGLVRIRALFRRSRPADAAVRALADAAWHRLGGTGSAPPVRVSPRPIVPFVCGARRPTVVLPVTIATDDAPRLVHVLRHEFAHVLRGDLRGRRRLALATALAWWNPLVWWLRSVARRASEEIADDVAARDTSAAAYARDLLSLCDLPRPGAAALAVVSGESDLSRRIRMLLNRSAALDAATSRRSRATRIVSAIALLASSTALLGVPLRAQDPQQEVARLRAQVATLQQQLAAQEARSAAARREADARAAEVEALRGMVATLRDRVATPDADGGARVVAAETTPVLQDTPPSDLASVALPDSSGSGAFAASVALAQQCIDLRTRERILRSRLERILPLSRAGQIPMTQVEETQLELRGAEAKLRLLDIAVAGEKAAHAAQIEIAASARERHGLGQISFQELASHLAQEARARAALTMLERLAGDAAPAEDK